MDPTMKPTAAGAWRPIANIPETFEARGVAVHFTTPELAGARVRPGPRATIELAINNPGGGRGIYVLPWESVSAFSTPTIHDRVLMTAVKDLAGLTPAAVRTCALAVAAEGFAGATAAAGHARDNDRLARTLANYHLLLAASRRHEPDATDLPEPGALCSAATMTALRPRFRGAASAIAGPLAVQTEVVLNAFEEIADALAPIGVREFCRHARVQAAVMAIRALRRDLARSCGGADSDGKVGPGARQIAFICAAAQQAVAAAETASSAAHTLASVPQELVRLWLHDSGQVAALAARPGWLIDGWERICLLWRLGGNAADARSVLDEMTALVPVLPAEADGWPGVTPRAAAEPGWRVHSAGASELPSAGCAQDAIARNEQLRALAA
jgi:rhodanese-related sulfurtransferase